MAAAKGSEEGDGKEEGGIERELEKGMVSGEEESWDVSEEEVVDWRDAQDLTKRDPRCSARAGVAQH